MDIIYVIIGIALLLVALSGWAMSTGESKRFTDADADGEPDETASEKARALEEFENDRVP